MDNSYLQYPNRKYGQDHEFYDWRLSTDRPRLEWSGGAKVAICFIVPLEFFPLNPEKRPAIHPGGMKTPYPDLRHYTVRDYGNRVGVFRILEELNEANARASFAVSAEVAKRYPPLLDVISEHEIVAHGLHTDAVVNEGMTAIEEMETIRQALNSFDTPPKGWLSNMRRQTSRTLGLLKASGVDFCLDWEMDQVPVSASVDGGDITLVPNNYELLDFTLFHTRGQTEESWLTQMKTAIDQLLGEYERFGSQMLGLTLTPYVIGQPFRIWALRELLVHIANTDGVEIFTCGEIAEQFKEQTP